MQQAYKFNATSDDEALEAIRYFKILGFIQAFDISKIGNVPHHIFAGRGAITWLHNDLKLYKNHPNKEVTLLNLHDMVILQRNDVNDATHYQTIYPDSRFYLTSDRDVYMMADGYWIASGIRPSELTPIKQKKEYLIRQNAGGFMYRTAYDKGYIPKDWIEIPAGATFATGKTRPLFRKDGFYWDDEEPIGGDGIPFWRETSINLRNAEVSGLDVVWEREEPSINEIIKTAEDYRQSQNEAPELTDFGLDISSVSADTVYHYYACPHIPSWPPIDGIILFDGRISNAEDYERLCSMIAAGINRKPDDFAIRSLTIVG